MAGAAFLLGGLLQGVGTGLTDFARQQREEAQRAAEREARRQDMQTQSDLSDRNAARNDERGLKNSTALATMQAGYRKEDDERTFQHQDAAEARKQAFEALRDDKRFGHEDARDDKTNARADARESRSSARAIEVAKIGAASRSGEGDNFSAAETRQAKALEQRYTTIDPDSSEKKIDYVAIANALGRMGKFDMAATYDPAWSGEAERRAAKARPGSAPARTPASPAAAPRATAAAAPKVWVYNVKTGRLE